MRMLMRVFYGLIVTIAALIAIAYFLPSSMAVERSIVINAPAQKVFPFVNDLRKHNLWSPWTKIDPDAKYAFTGPDAGKGQKVTWSSNHQSVGNGSQEIVESVADKRVATRLDFGEHGQAQAAFELAPDGAGTKVTWSFFSNLGANPMARYFGFFFSGSIRDSYDKGLKNLKETVEAQK